MSALLNQVKSRLNGENEPCDSSGMQQSQSHMQMHNAAATLPSSGVTSHFNNTPQTTLGHGHKGHRRGHSYGGVIGHHSSAFHHLHLESRTSHPNTQHPTIMVHSNSAHRGHRRALSGCLPLVGMGAVAWSSLRDLESSAGSPLPGQQLRSPEASRPSSPEILESSGAEKISPRGSLGKQEQLEEPELLDSLECGIGPCTLPRCFQGLANVQFFVGILALLVTLQQGVASGYVNSVITTIETRFEIPSRFSGLIASSYEMGNVVTVLFVSYLGAKRHIPRWIAIGVLTIVIGCVVFTLPHFLSDDHNNASNTANSYVTERLTKSINANLNASGHLLNENESSEHHTTSFGLQDPRRITKGSRNAICRSYPQSSKYISGHFGNKNSSESDEQENGVPAVKQELMSFGCSIEIIEEDGTKTISHGESYGHPLILFMIAQLLLGCGGSPLFTLGITYVDDHVPPELSSMYIGVVYSMAAFGPVLGFLLGAWLLTIPSSPKDGLDPDSHFIGMWWGGFLIAGTLLFIASLPFFTFPRLVKPKASKKEEFCDTEKNDCSSELKADKKQYGESIRDIPKSIWRLITNPTYVVTCLGGCMELNIVSGFVVFLPKYLETQFSLGKSQASLFVGGIAIPGACFGIFLGGYLMKRLQLKPSGAAKFVVTTNILCLVGYVLFFFLGCSNSKVAGANVPYPESSPHDKRLFHFNLTSPCNSDCSCDSSLDAQYVCHDGITYFTPCHAGCSVNLTQCACAGGATVSQGRCQEDGPCNTLIPFMIVLFFMTGTVAMTQMPLLMIVLRSVSPEERSFALGMQFVIFRLLGYIPSPIIFGNVIDSACLLWSVKRCSTLLPAVSGRCLLYDVLDFRYKYVGMLSGLKLLALALFLYDLFHLRRIEKEEEMEETQRNIEEGVHANSVISISKLFEESDTASAVTTATALNPLNSSSDP